MKIKTVWTKISLQLIIDIHFRSRADLRFLKEVEMDRNRDLKKFAILEFEVRKHELEGEGGRRLKG